MTKKLIININILNLYLNLVILQVLTKVYMYFLIRIMTKYFIIYFSKNKITNVIDSKFCFCYYTLYCFSVLLGALSIGFYRNKCYFIPNCLGLWDILL